MWRSVFGAEATWSIDRHMAASAVDALAVANWQRGGGKKKDRPKPIDRPGVGPARKKIGDASRLTPVQARALLDQYAPAAI